MLDQEAVRNWIQTLGVLAGIATGAVAAWDGVNQYKINAASAQLESDIRLSNAFTELMTIANARGATSLSAECVNELFDKKLIAQGDDPGAINSRIFTACVIILPVGGAQQDAAIAAIGELGRRYPILFAPAQQGLRSIAPFRHDPAELALARLNKP